MPKKPSKDCGNAYENPSCPYVTQINNSTCDMRDIKKALLGDDGTGLKSGIVFEISQLKNAMAVTYSWINLAKPIVVSVATTAIVTFLVTKFF